MREIFRRGLLALLLLVLLSAGRGQDGATPSSATEGAIVTTTAEERWQLLEEYREKAPPEEARKQVVRAVIAEIKKAAGDLGLQLPETKVFIEDHYYVVVSPRDNIQLVDWGDVNHSLTMEEIKAIEADPTLVASETWLDLPQSSSPWSVCVVPVPGSYAGAIELGPSSAEVMIPTAAHEWVHAYLDNQSSIIVIDSRLTAMKEITVEMAAREISDKISARRGWEKFSSAFACEEIHHVRTEAYFLLRIGKVDEAEASIESMRPVLCPTAWCPPSKLNQAFLALLENHCFIHEGGPEGEKLVRAIRELRSKYTNLGDFLDDIKEVVYFEDFLSLLEEKSIDYPEGQ